MDEYLTPAQIQQLRKTHYNATVVSVRKPHTDLAVFRVRPDFAIPVHKPGQYGTLGLGYWEPRVPGCQEENLSPADRTRVVKRAYSLSHPILDDQGQLIQTEQLDYFEFYIVLVRESGTDKPPALTPRLFALREGDRLYLGEKITGSYTLDPVQPEHTVIFLATGTGEAPHNYMIWHLLRRGHRQPIISVCCVRYWRDLAYWNVHHRLMELFPNYRYVPLTTREPENLGRKIYIQDLIASGELERMLGRPLDPNTMHVYLCGNPNMIGVPKRDPKTGEWQFPQPTGAVELLMRRGFQPDEGKSKGTIHYEKYW
ncbi:MAG: ferredoxin--NADP reductase [Gemmatales bacterium]|nr:ferredoxin--NADP reductase [Gemmatales bacterium]MDW7993895.1 ferredoxin--NADP reductase [Gemmatales bacterium]